MNGVVAQRRLGSALAAAVVISLLAVGACTGTDAGIGGPDVLDRDAAVGKLREAWLLRVARCNSNADDVNSFIDIALRRSRAVLDGAYYSTKDVESCHLSIISTSCGQKPRPCGLTPKEIYEGDFLQGGF